jgi:hypothetical protein
MRLGFRTRVRTELRNWMWALGLLHKSLSTEFRVNSDRFIVEVY